MKNKLDVLTYLINTADMYEQEFEEYKDFCRYHNVDEVDLLEQIIRKVKRDLSRKTLRDVMTIMHLTK